jgi:hypothetical protein
LGAGPLPPEIISGGNKDSAYGYERHLIMESKVYSKTLFKSAVKKYLL